MSNDTARLAAIEAGIAHAKVRRAHIEQALNKMKEASLLTWTRKFIESENAYQYLIKTGPFDDGVLKPLEYFVAEAERFIQGQADHLHVEWAPVPPMSKVGQWQPIEWTSFQRVGECPNCHVIHIGDECYKAEAESDPVPEDGTIEVEVEAEVVITPKKRRSRGRGLPRACRSDLPLEAKRLVALATPEELEVVDLVVDELVAAIGDEPVIPVAPKKRGPNKKRAPNMETSKTPANMIEFDLVPVGPPVPPSMLPKTALWTTSIKITANQVKARYMPYHGHLTHDGMERVRYIAGHLDRRHLGFITLSERDGYFILIDGVKRVMALIKSNRGDMPLLAIVHHDLSLEDEIVIRTGPTYYEHLETSGEGYAYAPEVQPEPEMVAELVAELVPDPEPEVPTITLDDILSSLGLTLNNGGNTKDWMIRAVETVKSLYDSAGPEVLARALKVIVSVWGGSSDSLSSDIIFPVAILILRRGDSISDKRLIASLDHISPQGLLLKSKKLGLRSESSLNKLGEKTRRRYMPKTIIAMYNSRARSDEKIAEWTNKDGVFNLGRRGSR